MDSRAAGHSWYNSGEGGAARGPLRTVMWLDHLSRDLTLPGEETDEGGGADDAAGEGVDEDAGGGGGRGLAGGLVGGYWGGGAAVRKAAKAKPKAAGLGGAAGAAAAAGRTGSAKFVSYLPSVFARLREQAGISSEEFADSFTATTKVQAAGVE